MKTNITSDPIEMLMNDHRNVEELFQKIKAATGAQKEEYFDKLCSELAIHTALEEEFFYPEFQKHGKDNAPDQIKEALEEHDSIEQKLQQGQDLAVDSPEFSIYLEALEAALRHHIHEEESEMFPQAEENISEEKLYHIGEKMLEHKEELLPSTVQEEI
jgi:iron-sulfur cluster repair protein YtfE (RIC family)